MALRRVRHVSVGIDRPYDDVRAFLSEPENFPAWAEGLGGSFRHVGGLDWRVDTPMGEMIVRFSEPNEHGILDHTLFPEDGEPMENPMRVVRNGDGAEVTFTLMERPGMTDEAFESDAAAVRADLDRLKALLEGGAN